MDLGLSYPTLILQQFSRGLSRPEGTSSTTVWIKQFDDVLPLILFTALVPAQKQVRKNFEIQTFLAWLSSCGVSSSDQPHLLLVLSQQDWKSSTFFADIKAMHIYGGKNTKKNKQAHHTSDQHTHTLLHVTHVTCHTDMTPDMRGCGFSLQWFQRHWGVASRPVKCLSTFSGLFLPRFGDVHVVTSALSVVAGAIEHNSEYTQPHRQWSWMWSKRAVKLLWSLLWLFIWGH